MTPFLRSTVVVLFIVGFLFLFASLYGCAASTEILQVDASQCVSKIRRETGTKETQAQHDACYAELNARYTAIDARKKHQSEPIKCSTGLVSVCHGSSQSNMSCVCKPSPLRY